MGVIIIIQKSLKTKIFHISEFVNVIESTTCKYGMAEREETPLISPAFTGQAAFTPPLRRPPGTAPEYRPGYELFTRKLGML